MSGQRMTLAEAVFETEDAYIPGMAKLAEAIDVLRDYAASHLRLSAGVPAPLAGNYVLDYFEFMDRRSAGGLHLPDSVRNRAHKARVIAAGPGNWSKDGTRRLPMDFKVGDIVIAYRMSTYRAIPHQPEFGDTYGGRDLVVVPESEILCLLEI